MKQNVEIFNECTLNYEAVIPGKQGEGSVVKYLVS